MARLRGHRDLDMGSPLYVKRAITIGGRALAPGDAFNWKALGLDVRLLTRLWDQRRIGHEQLADRNGAEMPASAVREPKRKKK